MTDNRYIIGRDRSAQGVVQISGDVLIVMDVFSKNLRSNRAWLTLLECALILAVSLLAEMTHFSAQQGRAVICADSAQYVDTAEAMVNGDRLPHFEMRKSGYSLFLAVVLLAFGQLGWPVVAVQHAMLAMLPLIAYGLGRVVHSRLLGWFAAAITIAELQTVIYGNRIMSESLYALLLSVGIFLLVVAITRKKYVGWLAGAGLMLGLAWLTRGTATPIIAATGLFMVYWLRADRRKLALSLLMLGLPIAMCVAFECSLNGVLSGRWRPSNGTVGASLTLRMRYYDGVEIPNTVAAAAALRWLPGRSIDDAYLCSKLDVWFARYRAIHDGGMNEWTYDDLMAEFGRDLVLANLGSYVSNTLTYGIRHLFRQPQNAAPTLVSSSRRKGWLVHAASVNDEEAETYWYAYWGQPHMPLSESVALVDRMKIAAQTRAPFGDGAMWSHFRYYLTWPPLDAGLRFFRWLGSAWPMLGLLTCLAFRVHRNVCLLILAMWLAEAFFIALVIPTFDRLQFIWIVVDTTMAASIFALPLQACASRYFGQAIGEMPSASLAAT